MSDWTCTLELDSNRLIRSGSTSALCDAIRNGADLRIYTEFRFNEHINVISDNPQMIREVAEFRVTYLINNCWTAGIMNLRQPITLPNNFGLRPSMSFFLYNQDGRQAIARPYLNGSIEKGKTDSSKIDDSNGMSKYHKIDSWDADTNAPSSNFIYDFEVFRYWVRNDWQEILSHKGDGAIVSGSVDTLIDAFTRGCEVKVGIRGLCNDLAKNPTQVLDHEVFIQAGSCYYHTEDKLFIVGTHPVIRVVPAIPLAYISRGWDFGWLMLRTDGFTALRLCDPYTLKFNDENQRYDIRWFVR